MDLKINPVSEIPKYQQIADSLTSLIESGMLKVGDKLPSIDLVSRNNKVAKETVVQAYRHLNANGIVTSSKRQGFYVQTSVTNKKWRVMVLFNIMSPSKSIIYKSIVDTLKDKAQVELFFHNYNLEMFESIIRSKATMFHYFIVMPHYDPAATAILQSISPERLIILDRPLLNPILGASSVHQDFKEDIYDALIANKDKIAKYWEIIMLSPNDKYFYAPILKGLQKFGKKMDIPVHLHTEVQPDMLQEGTLFITLTEELLINSIELLQQTKLRLGKDIGIISYNDDPLKRILAGGIATLTTDFEQMGKTVASLVIDKQVQVTRNPFHLIIRKSL